MPTKRKIRFSYSNTKKFSFYVKIIFTSILLCTSLGFGQIADEYQVKSAYIEKVSRFISWPEKKNIDEKDSFVIGIVGNNSFRETTSTYFKQQTMKNKKVSIIKVDNSVDINKCDLLFIDNSEKENLKKYIGIAEKNHVLVVADTKGFAEKGVHINLPIKDERVDLEVNYECMKAAGFSIESILLIYAEIVECDKQDGAKK